MLQWKQKSQGLKNGYSLKLEMTVVLNHKKGINILDLLKLAILKLITNQSGQVKNSRPIWLPAALLPSIIYLIVYCHAKKSMLFNQYDKIKKQQQNHKVSIIWGRLCGYFATIEIYKESYFT